MKKLSDLTPEQLEEIEDQFNEAVNNFAEEYFTGLGFEKDLGIQATILNAHVLELFDQLLNEGEVTVCLDGTKKGRH